MTRTVRNKSAPVVISSEQTVDAGPYRVTDLGDGTARLQLDVALSWSDALRILKVVNTNENTHPHARTTDQTGAAVD